MFCVKHKKTGKYLKAFNGSFNHASFYAHCDLAAELIGTKAEVKEAEKKDIMVVLNRRKEVPWSAVVERMWCLKTPNGGQIYKNEGAILNSLGNSILEECEIVPVKIVVDSKRKKK